MSNKYTVKWDRANMHVVSLRFVNWQYDKIAKASADTDITVSAFIRQAVAEKLNKMGIDLYDKGEKVND